MARRRASLQSFLVVACFSRVPTIVTPFLFTLKTSKLYNAGTRVHPLTVALRDPSRKSMKDDWSFIQKESITELEHVGPGGGILSEDPEMIEFVVSGTGSEHEKKEIEKVSDNSSLDISVLRLSGMYIADHRESTVVIHIPGEFIEETVFANLLDDISLCWLLGLKIVLVVGGRFDHDCHGLSCEVTFDHPHEYHNSIHVTNDKLLRSVQEEAGYVRFEVERMLNKSLRLHAGMGSVSKHAPAPNGNVVSGNFYTAAPFGVVKGIDYQSTGYPKHVQAQKIEKILKNNDIVLLTPVGTSRTGDLVSVNSSHLAAFVAASLRASKIIYLSSEGTVLRSKKTNQRLLDISLSCSKDLVKHYDVQVHDAGFVSFDRARETLDYPTVEKLLYLGWSNWALEHGVKRAHVVGPSDGALLEELFTAMDGANTCVRQENDGKDLNNVFSEESDTFGPVPPYL